MNLQLASAGAIGALLLAIGAYFYGIDIGEDRAAARQAAQAQRMLAKAEKMVANAQRVQVQLFRIESGRRAAMREIFREVPKIIVRPGYGVPCVDDDGVQLLERAVSAANGRGMAGGRADGGSADVHAAAD
jgi:hypothetical protein